LKVLIVDDEPPARDRLCRLLDDIEEHEVVGEAGNGDDALEQAKNLQPDIVLLDIRMPGMDGIETAHHLNSVAAPPAVIFTSAYDEYAIDAFEANAVGYLLKPVRQFRLEQALDQAKKITHGTLNQIRKQSGIASQRKHICVQLRNEFKLIPVHQIYYFIADQKYVRIVHQKGRDLIDDSLKSLETEFKESFIRVHRKAVVAVDEIHSLRKNENGQTEILLRNVDHDSELVVSRRHLKKVRQRLRKG
tara:strand:- start:512 stop:1252 length:741 start_codon:yes stop_codon:yes gene_type:complete